MDTNKQPSHVAYQVRDRENTKSIWTRIGHAWAHADGRGVTLQLDAVPLDSRVTLASQAKRKSDDAPCGFDA